MERQMALILTQPPRNRNQLLCCFLYAPKQAPLTTQKTHCFSEVPHEIKKTEGRSACQLHPRCTSTAVFVGTRSVPALGLMSSPSLPELRAPANTPNRRNAGPVPKALAAPTPSHPINTPLTDQQGPRSQRKRYTGHGLRRCLHSLLCLSLPPKNGWICMKSSLQNAASGRKEKTKLGSRDFPEGAGVLSALQPSPPAHPSAGAVPQTLPQ